MPPLNRKKAFAWITVSAVALTGVGAFAQLAVRDTTVPFSLFLRFALAALLLLPAAPRERLRSLRKIARVQWLRVGFVMCSQLALFTYLADGTLLNGMLLYNTGPLFTPLLAWLLWRTTIRTTGIVGILLGFTGVALVLNPPLHSIDGLMLLGLASGFFNSCSQLSLFAGGKDDDALSESDNLFQFFTLCAAGCLALLVARPTDLVAGARHLADPGVLGSFLALSAFGLLNQYGRSLAYRNVRNPANLGPFLYLSIALSALVDWAAYGILPTWHTLAGGAFIFAAAVVVAWRTFRTGANPPRSTEGSAPTAVITIDFVNDIVHPDGRLAGAARWVAEHRVLESVNHLTAWARERGAPVIHVGLALREEARTAYARSPLLGVVWAKQACVAGSWGAAFHDALVVGANDVVLHKSRVGAFSGSGLEALLRERGVGEIVLCGVSTDMTIVSTGRQAHDLDFSVTIAENACGAANDESHALGIAVMRRLAQIQSLP